MHDIYKTTIRQKDMNTQKLATAPYEEPNQFTKSSKDIGIKI